MNVRERFLNKINDFILGLNTTLRQKSLAFIALTLSTLVFFIIFPFSGKPRFLHSASGVLSEELTMLSNARGDSYQLLYSRIASEYSIENLQGHPQKRVRQFLLFFDQTSDCPAKLVNENNELFAERKSCDSLTSELRAILKTKKDDFLKYAVYENRNELKQGQTLVRFRDGENRPDTAMPFILVKSNMVGQKQTLLALSYPTIPHFGLMEQLWGRGKFRATFYFLSLVLLSFSWLLFKSSRKISLSTAFCAVFLCLLALVPHFSGNDETAHFSMLQAAAQVPIEDNSGKHKIASEINSEGRDLMFLEDFFQLHGVNPPKRGECLHSILGSCGITEMPAKFYSIYLPWISENIFEEFTPKRILTLVRFQNILFFSVTILLCMYILKLRLDFFLPFMLIFGAAHSTIFSLSNDIFGVNLGIFLTAVQFWIIKRRPSLKQSLPLILFSAFAVFVGTRIDSNAFSAVPVLFSSTLIYLIFMLEKRYPSVSQKSALKLMYISFFVSTAGYLAFRNFFPQISAWLKEYLNLPNEVAILSNLGVVELKVVFSYVLEFAAGLFGRFVWSHTSYPETLTYLFLIATAVWVLFFAISFAQDERKNTSISLSKVLLPIFLLLQLLGLALIIEAVGSFGAKTGFGTWSFLVPRFYFPGIACIFVPFLLAAEGTRFKYPKRGLFVLSLISICFATANIMYFFPKFFLADAW